ncbi:serine hydrolase [Aliikangiella sp. G2MR2-5]|uniref:serine hydrolase domain-containing protein n=1 Tax=Aliikangiella sp. G2MR2-5 TaxID=2788943 RepID=UPI0018A9FF9C|nr:serine hydrolase domain-containing protein [Aliikangiella sp. G2MR2-5]
MLKTGILILISFITLTTHAQIPQSKEIDKLFSEWDKPDTPGGALGIIQNGKLIYSRGYGMANLDYDIANSPKTVFRIASTSKQFTAASIILLVQKGKLGLDDPLTDFFPEFPDYARQITIRHLLHHTSGIRDYLTLSYLSGLDENDHYTDKEIMKWLINQKTNNFKPGENFLYSNSGYWLLGKIVEKVTGRSMAEFAENEIFKPLKMNNTHFHNDHTMIVKNRASGYSPLQDGSFKIDMTTLDMIGDGGVFTTIEDMKKWDDASYQSDILNKDFWTMMETTGKLNNGAAIEYSAGLGVREFYGLKMISHGGAFVGYRANYIRFPQEKFTIVILANRSDARVDQKALQIVDLFLKDKFQKPESRKKVDSVKSEALKLSEKELKQWQGDYWYPALNFSRSIVFKDNALFYQRGSDDGDRLVPIAKNQFTMESNDRVIITFSMNKDKVAAFSFKYGGELPDIATRYESVNYDSEEFGAFSGRFYSEELDTTYDLKLQDNKLSIFINGEKFSTLRSIMTDLLTDDKFGTFSFNRGSDGAIKSFTLAAGRVKNMVFLKK